MSDGYDGENETDNIEDTMLYGTEIFCAGCSYPEYQDNIRKVREHIAVSGNCTVEIHRERNNTIDKNALLLLARCGNEHLKLGYVPLKAIPKVHSALSKREVCSCVVKEVRKVYVRREGKSVWKVWVWITKRKKWLNDCVSNVYNADLSHFL